MLVCIFQTIYDGHKIFYNYKSIFFKSLAKKNQYLEGTAKGHDSYSVLKFPNSIPVSRKMTRILYIPVYNIFMGHHFHFL